AQIFASLVRRLTTPGVLDFDPSRHLLGRQEEHDTRPGSHGRAVHDVLAAVVFRRDVIVVLLLRGLRFYLVAVVPDRRLAVDGVVGAYLARAAGRHRLAPRATAILSHLRVVGRAQSLHAYGVARGHPLRLRAHGARQ